MKTIRIFISSPRDVGQERALTETIINRVGAEMGLSVEIRYSALLQKKGHGTGGNGPIAADARLVLCPSS